MSRITLLSDFGTRDGYIGAVKGVIAGLFPGVRIDDVAHDLPAGDVAAGARALERYWNRWPPGTVHFAVVDPGVGSGRRALVVEADRRFLVAPDNGILSPVLDAAAEWLAVEIVPSRYLPASPSSTFHGRDVFAPVCAYLAQGVHRSRFGPEVVDPVRFSSPEAMISDEGMVGEVVSTDRFGNLITNLLEGDLPDGVRIEIDGATIPMGRSYSDVPARNPVAIWNSDGRLEVAARDGSAAELLDAGVGSPVRITLPSAPGPRSA